MLTFYFFLFGIDVDECAESRQTCGYGAQCTNLPGGFECQCPSGHSGDPYRGLCTPEQRRCVADGDCSPNERCVQPGECVCPPPFYTDVQDGNQCKSK